MRRDRKDFDTVYVLELVFFRLCRTYHTCEFIVQSEEILIRYRGESLVLDLYLDALFSFERLMKTVRISSALQRSSRELVDYYDLPVIDDVIFIAAHCKTRFESIVDLEKSILIFNISEIFDFEEFLGFSCAALFKTHCFVLILHRVIALVERLYEISRGNIYLPLVIVVGIIFASRYYERSTRFVDKNTVHLVDKSELQRTLYPLFFRYYHIVS